MIEISKPIDPPKYKVGDIIHLDSNQIGIIRKINKFDPDQGIQTYDILCIYPSKRSKSDEYNFERFMYVPEFSIEYTIDFDDFIHLYLYLAHYTDTRDMHSLRTTIDNASEKFIKIRDEIKEIKDEILNYNTSSQCF